MRASFAWLSLFSTLVISGCVSQPDRDTPVLVMAPQLRRLNLVNWDYDPNKLIRVVNALRAMGKRKSLPLLRMYFFSTSPPGKKEDEDVQLICRFLFVNPD